MGFLREFLREAQELVSAFQTNIGIYGSVTKGRIEEVKFSRESST